MGCTVDGKPFVGEAGGRRRGLWVCAGFNGHGEFMVCGGLRCGGADAGGGRYGAVIAVRGGYCMHDDGRRRPRALSVVPGQLSSVQDELGGKAIAQLGPSCPPRRPALRWSPVHMLLALRL